MGMSRGTRIGGIAVPFNTPSLPMRTPDIYRFGPKGNGYETFTEIMLPGCFGEDWLPSTKGVRLFYGDDLLGCLENETLEFWSGENALFYSCLPPVSPVSESVLALIEDKYLKGVAVGFTVLSESWKGNVRTVRRARLERLELTLYPTYPKTTIKVSTKEGSKI